MKVYKMTNNEIKKKSFSLILQMGGLMPEDWINNNSPWVEELFVEVFDKLDTLEKYQVENADEK